MKSKYINLKETKNYEEIKVRDLILSESEEIG